MNRGILGILLLLSTLTASAQYGGDWVVGGRVNYVGGGKIVTPDRGRVNTGFTLKVAPSLAYFIPERFYLFYDMMWEGGVFVFLCNWKVVADGEKVV